MGSFQTVEFIQTFMNYQENIKRCVCIIYDPPCSSPRGAVLESVKNIHGTLPHTNFCWGEVKISNSALVSSLMTELEPEAPATQCNFDRLVLSTNPFMGKNLEFLVECVDDLSMEQQKI